MRLTSAIFCFFVFLSASASAQVQYTHFHAAEDVNSFSIYSVWDGEGGQSLHQSYTCLKDKKQLFLISYSDEPDPSNLELKRPHGFSKKSKTGICTSFCKHIFSAASKKYLNLTKPSFTSIYYESPHKIKSELKLSMQDPLNFGDTDEPERAKEIKFNMLLLKKFQYKCGFK